jgi:hypothetical protein
MVGVLLWSGWLCAAVRRGHRVARSAGDEWHRLGVASFRRKKGGREGRFSGGLLQRVARLRFGDGWQETNGAADGRCILPPTRARGRWTCSMSG